MSETKELLRQFVEDGSEEAFGRLVSLYVDFTYSTALRCVNGNSHLAKDVVQAVFADLARQAPRLGTDVMVGGWLHRHTWFLASKAMRTENRRVRRDREAMQIQKLHDNAHDGFKRIASALDEAIEDLSPKEKAPLLLRFFEQKDFQSVGASLGISEEAARKRVDRAVDRLHAILTRRGFALSATALAGILSTEIVTGAPVGLAVTATNTALVSTAIGSTALTTLKLILMTKTKAAFITAVVAAAFTTPLVIQHQANKRLQSEVQALQNQVSAMDELRAENELLSKLALRSNAPATVDPELLRLRNEAGMLRQATNELAGLKKENQQLRTAAATKAEQKPTQEDFVAKEAWAFAGYATPEATAQSMFWALREGNPTSFEAYLNGLAPKMREKMQAEAQKRGPNAFAELAAGELKDVSGLRVLQRVPLAEDKVLLQVHNGNTKAPAPTLIMRKVGEEWKFAGILRD